LRLSDWPWTGWPGTTSGCVRVGALNQRPSSGRTSPRLGVLASGVARYLTSELFINNRADAAARNDMTQQLTKLRRSEFGELVELRVLEAANHETAVDPSTVACVLALGVLRAGGHCASTLAELPQSSIWPRLRQQLGSIKSPEPSQLMTTGLFGPASVDAQSPFVIDGENAMLQRVWRYQDQIASVIRALGHRTPPLDTQDLGRSAAQDTVLKTVSESALTIISGGPGTGKTTLAGAVLGAWLDAGMPPHRIAAAAPTGKAAARLSQGLQTAHGRALLKPMTLHRLLQVRHGRPATIAPQALLAIDALLVDETSMVDLELMAALLSRLRPDARLVLLGDRDQLPPIGLGNVFSDLCQCRSLGSNVIELTRNYRFSKNSALGRLASASKTGDADAVLDLLRGESEQLNWIEAADPERAVLGLLPSAWSPLPNDPVEAHRVAKQFRILTPHRLGSGSADRLNKLIREQLGLPRDQWAAGDLLTVTGNDYVNELFNGDQAVVTEASPGQLQAHFLLDQARSLALARLDQLAAAWAITVHRSQGSEFEHVMLVLPERISPLLTRQLFYTATTRAREHLTVIGSEAAIRHALSVVERRESILPQLIEQRG